MAADVIYPSAFARTVIQSDAKDAQRARDVEKLVKFEANAPGKRGHHFVKPSDRLIAARAVGRIVAEAVNEANLTVDAIAKASGARLDRYKIMPTDASPNAARLQGKVRGYLDIAEAVAQLARRDPIELKVQILSETSLWASQPGLQQSEADPRAASLAMMLREMGVAVAKRTKLETAFRKAAMLTGQWDLVTQSFRHAETRVLWLESKVGTYEHWSEAPPIPSIVLFRKPHTVVRAPAIVESLGYSAADDSLSTELTGSTRELNLLIQRELRLAIGPANANGDPQVLFESRAHISASLDGKDDERFELLCPFTLKEVDDGLLHLGARTFWLKIGDRWHRAKPVEPLDSAQIFATSSEEAPLEWEVFPPEQGFILMHWWFSWIAVNEASASHWLDRSHHDVEVHLADGEREIQLPNWFAPPTIAFQVEMSLKNGGLEKALEAACASLISKVDEWSATWRRDAELATGRLLVNWHSQQPS